MVANLKKFSDIKSVEIRLPFEYFSGTNKGKLTDVDRSLLTQAKLLIERELPDVNIVEGFQRDAFFLRWNPSYAR